MPVPMIGPLLAPDLLELVREGRPEVLTDALARLDPADAADVLDRLPPDAAATVIGLLPAGRAGAAFAHLPPASQAALLRAVPAEVGGGLLTALPPDDQARLLDTLPADVTARALAAVRPDAVAAARELLAYPSGTAGRLMTPRFVALDPGMTAADALGHIRRAGPDPDALEVVYVLDAGRLVRELRLGTLVLADPAAPVGDLRDRPPVAVPAAATRDEVVQAFRRYDRSALPVTDETGRMLGVVTADDVLDAADQEATEDIHRLGGSEALDAPYLAVGFGRMLRKRGGWLSALFVGEMLTATAMAGFEDELAKAVVLAMFVPLIISSGGNSGSQAATLVVRSLALGELRLRDWGRVLLREVRTGLALGAWLGLVGFLRVTAWHYLGLYDYGPHHWRIGLTVWASLIGVVGFGSVAGAMLPFALRRLGFDPATSSAPFVATLVDVTGIVIYFSAAAVLLAGTVL